jgi:lysozyme
MAGTSPRFSHLIVAVCLAGAVACGGGEGPAPTARLAAPSAPSAPSPPPAAAALEHGIDVSGHSGAIDWTQVAAAGHTFAFLKATEGVDLKDPAFDTHWEALGAAGLVRGAYHFYVTEDDPEAQARFFIETVELRSGDLAPVVDVELIGHGTQPGLAERLQRYLDRIEAHYGVKPILYTAPSFWDQHLTDGFGEYPLWVAEYEVDTPRLPSGWTAWHLWQWKADAEVPGVAKGADLSRLNRSGDVELHALVVP